MINLRSGIEHRLLPVACSLSPVQGEGTPAARSTFAVSRCFAAIVAAHGSSFRAATRAGTVAAVKLRGSRSGVSSSHASGTATGAPGRARVEYAAIAVLPR